ncbi:putative glucan endo-1,3-beta-glucosidase BG5 [Drosera capensis]
MSLDYVLFTSTSPVMTDGDLSYTNLYDATIDSFVWAMEKQGGGDVDLVVTQSGWPHDGNGNITTLDLAATFNKNFLKHVSGGTPKRPSAAIDGYLFALFDEDLKPPGAEQNWGLFKPNMDPKYDITRCSTELATKLFRHACSTLAHIFLAPKTSLFTGSHRPRFRSNADSESELLISNLAT